MKLIPTILCGGAGSRLWPVSREMHPKPFIRLADGQSLLQKAWLRGAMLPDVVEVMTVSNRELLFKTLDDYGEIAESRKIALPNSFVLEPCGRNTAPAIAAAALTIAGTHGREALMLVLAADHLISDQPAFAQAVSRAVAIARQGKLVTFGITPESPETGYGYIEADMDRPIEADGDVLGFAVRRFVEKPNLEKAEEYVASGRYQWNSGMFCFSAGALLEEMERHCPAIVSAVRACLAQSATVKGQGVSQVLLDAGGFSAVADDSIDFALLEKSSSVAVVPCSIGWSDIGSWDALGDLVAPDACGNRVEGGEVVLHEVSNCYIRGDERMIGAVGVDNLIVVDTPDALLVAGRERAQEVKHLYASLKARGHEAHKLHRSVNRPWGVYTVLETGPNFKIKRIEVKPGARLSLQMHYHRSEHWIVVSGMARVVNGEHELLVNTNESTYIPAGHRHRLENPGLLPLVMIEVQNGAYLGEDDIVRFDDIYGRCPAKAQGEKK
ncbi:MAG: mannose-1-phosphate guanylyltransferase/mannose-6-phosphate isomerase [Candidatus Accumulibacter sp.]|jgi:mannose-1-phosphate guanylyltransferase|nr:mannose-1-phosphate guanylyltransferase/mannose-6-phosphate isomerase [Accumulibacter sp.]